MFQITSWFEQLPEPTYPSEMMEQTIRLHQHEVFFQLAFEKEQRRNHLIGVFSGKRPAAIKISSNLRCLGPINSAVEHSHLEGGYFDENDPQRFADKCASLHHCVVIVNNNDIAGNPTSYLAFYNACPNTLFIAWDWDNHHWLALSRILATHSDLYVPSHQDNIYLLSRYNANITDVAAGVAQWTRQFLVERQEEMLQSVRSNMPLGYHVFYQLYEYRTRVLMTLHSTYPSIGPSSNYHGRTDEERFKEWIGYKLHLIVPVLNDIPIRLFDALASGGIPMIPDSLRFAHVLRDAHPDDFLCYSARDIVATQDLVAKGCEMFDRHGEVGVARRAEYALRQHHGDVRISKILDAATQLYGLIWK